jgi:flagellar assembly protein FliH
MAKIYKSFMVKMDKKHPEKISTGQLTRADEKEIMQERIMADVFRELPIDKFIRSKKEAEEAAAKAGEEQSGPEGKADGGPSGEKTGLTGGAPGEADPVADPREDIRPDSQVTEKVKGRLATLIDAANRRANELDDTRENLHSWEKALLEREQYTVKQEEKALAEISERRKKLEAEAHQILEMAKKSADTILKTAQVEAETMKKALQIELETVRGKAYKEGFALGEEKGISTGEKAGAEEIRLEWQGLMQEAEMLITELQTSRLGILKASEEEMVKLVLAFAKRVIKVECETRPEILLQNIDAALNKISDVDKVVLRVNLRDKSMAEARKQEFLKRLSGVTELRIVEDSSLAPGGIKIETGVGAIDATIETQVEELEKSLLKILKKAE